MSSYSSQNTRCVLLFWTVDFRGKYAYIQAKSLFPQYGSIKPRERLYRNAKSPPTCLVLLDRTCRVLDFASSFYDKHRPYASAIYWADQTPIHGIRVVTDFMSSCQKSSLWNTPLTSSEILCNSLRRIHNIRLLVTLQQNYRFLGCYVQHVAGYKQDPTTSAFRLYLSRQGSLLAWSICRLLAPCKSRSSLQAFGLPIR